MDLDVPNLTTHQLLYLVKSLEMPTWTAAADSLGVSQSALSQAVAEVERRLGVVLYDRSGRQRTPTPELRAIAPLLRSILAAMSDLDTSLHQFSTGHRGLLRVGMIDSAALGAPGEALRSFRKGSPDVEIQLVVDGSRRLIERTTAGELDLAIAVASVANSVPKAGLKGKSNGGELSVSSQPLMEDPIYVYAPTQDLAHAAPQHWGPWISYPPGSVSREIVVAALGRAGAEFLVAAESSNPDVIRQMVRVGMGWGVLPASVGEGDKGQDGPFRVPGPPLAQRPISVFRRRSSLANTAIDRFVELLMRST